MKGRKYRSKFNKEWMKEEKFKKWLKEADDDKYSAYCSICKNSFDVGNIRMPQLLLTSLGSNQMKDVSPLEYPPALIKSC